MPGSVLFWTGLAIAFLLGLVIALFRPIQVDGQLVSVVLYATTPVQFVGFIGWRSQKVSKLDNANCIDRDFPFEKARLLFVRTAEIKHIVLLDLRNINFLVWQYPDRRHNFSDSRRGWKRHRKFAAILYQVQYRICATDNLGDCATVIGYSDVVPLRVLY